MLDFETAVLIALQLPDRPVHPLAFVIETLTALQLIKPSQDLQAPDSEIHTITSMIMTLTLNSINDR